MKFSQNIKDEVIRKLQEKKAFLPCPRCGHKHFTILDGYINFPIQQDLQNVVIGGPSVPCVGIACTNCGCIMFHALGSLGLLNKDEENDSRE